jgi:hypothetical protein
MKSTPTIKQIEDYSCTAYGVTMEQVKKKNTKIKESRQAKRLIVFLLIEHNIIAKGMVMTRYNWSYEIVNKAYLKIAISQGNDVELNSAIVGFEKEFIN